MVMYDNEYTTKENKNWTKDKNEPQHIMIIKNILMGFVPENNK